MIWWTKYVSDASRHVPDSVRIHAIQRTPSRGRWLQQGCQVQSRIGLAQSDGPWKDSTLGIELRWPTWVAFRSFENCWIKILWKGMRFPPPIGVQIDGKSWLIPRSQRKDTTTSPTLPSTLINHAEDEQRKRNLELLLLSSERYSTDWLASVNYELSRKKYDTLIHLMSLPEHGESFGLSSIPINVGPGGSFRQYRRIGYKGLTW